MVKVRNNMEKEYRELSKKVESIESILKHLLVIELYKNDMTQEDIGKSLGMSKTTVNNLLKGIKKQK